MLHEITTVTQNIDEPLERWFYDRDIDLIVWLDESAHIIGFQLCYGKPHNEHALTWNSDVGYTHCRIDNGESRAGRHKAAPILIPAGPFEPNLVAQEFNGKSKNIEGSIAHFVYRKLLEFPSHS